MFKFFEYSPFYLAMAIVDALMILILIQHSFGQVTLRRVNEEACSGDDLTFSCKATKSGLLVWTLTALPSVNGVVDSFGQSLNSNPNAVRITSTDSSSGPNPSSITIENVTAADNGATVQCRIVNMEMSNSITLSIRPPECSIALQATAVTGTSVTVMLMWTKCEGAEPATVSLSWFPEQNMCNVRYIGSLPANYEITNLVPSTNYTIMANYIDTCGSVSAVVVAATLPSTGMDFHTSSSHIVPAPTAVAQVPTTGAACIPAVSVLSTILVILLVLVLILTVTVLLLCCKLRTLNTAHTSSPETDTVKKAGRTSPLQHTDVEMTHNPAYGPIATLKGQAQYEEVAS